MAIPNNGKYSAMRMSRYNTVIFLQATFKICWRHGRHGTLFTWLTLYEGNPPVTGGLPLQRASDRELWCFFVVSLNVLLHKQSICRWFQTPCSNHAQTHTHTSDGAMALVNTASGTGFLYHTITWINADFSLGDVMWNAPQTLKIAINNSEDIDPQNVFKNYKQTRPNPLGQWADTILTKLLLTKKLKTFLPVDGHIPYLFTPILICISSLGAFYSEMKKWIDFF